MEYRILGKTGLKISRMGFGGIPIQKIDAQGTRKLMEKLKDAGVNYIDTARGYTVSESYLGEALEGIREHFILATKSMARDKAGMAKDIDISRGNLRTDYIDLYQVHNPTVAQFEQVIAPGGALEALLEAKEAGKIGHIGITAHSLEVFERALEQPWVETIMFPHNIVENQGAKLMKRCTEKNNGQPSMMSAAPSAPIAAAAATTASPAPQASTFPVFSSLRATCPVTVWKRGPEAATPPCPPRPLPASAAVPARAAAPTTCPSGNC